MSSDDSVSFEEDAGSSDEYIAGSESEETESEGEVRSEVKKKRKLVNRNSWKRNVRKLNRASGKSYINAAGKKIAARKTGDDCRCKYRCFEKVDLDKRSKILENFNSIGDKASQDEYLSGLITCKPIQRKRPKLPNNGTKSREVSNSYCVSTSIFH